MPRRKVAENDVVVPAETPKRTPASKPRSAAATHKRASKKAAEPEQPLSSTAPAVAAEEVIPTAVQTSRQASHEEIALLAYSYWEARGRVNGRDEEDWFRAEREII